MYSKGTCILDCFQRGENSMISDQFHSNCQNIDEISPFSPKVNFAES